MSPLDPTADATIRPLGPPSPAHPDAVPLYGSSYEREDPARMYGELRKDHGAVVPVLLVGDIPAWLVIGYRELHHVVGDPNLFARDSRHWNQWERVPPDWPLMAFVGYQPSILFTAGAEHRRRSGAISDALAEVDQFELRARCEQFADGLIDDFAGSGKAELLTQYAYAMPVLAVAGIMGIPPGQIQAVARDVVTALDGGEDSLEAFGRVAAAMSELVQTKRLEPGPDVVSRMVTHRADLTDEELAQDLIIMITAGQETTSNWIGNTLRLMLIDDRFSLTLAGGRQSVGQAMNEVLWDESPAQGTVGRWATRDTQLGGRYIKAGDLLVVGLAGGNADPQVRSGLDVGAGGNHAHLSFSHGDHGCPYPAPEIAEVIAETAVEVLLDRLPDVRLALPPNELQWRSSFQIRGLTALPVEFSPTPPVGASR
ncbi:cytochrome P450 [Actinoallomurus sp. NPDC050550]|uniref:cytochrome P450 n=1 Tax=Actinoallomurus sp. NPDC050550 TaxID=3154937 RepID=UPI0033F8E2D0